MSISRDRSRKGRDAVERSAFAQAFLPAAIGVVLLAAGLIVAGWTVSGLGLLLGAGAMGSGMATVRYRRLSLVRRRERLEQAAGRFASTIRELEREVESLTEKREDLCTSMESRREERLAEIQEQALHDRLKHHFVGEVREVDGLTHTHVVRLKSTNIRTAAELTPEAIDSIRRISDRARARLKMWRSALEEKYADEVPDSLSPAQERRLQRYIQHRIEDIDDQIARTREKINTQETERERIEKRLDEMPTVPLGRYLRYLLRLGTLPDRGDGPPAPTTPNEEEASPERAPVPEPLDEDRPWWTG
jgi:TolA-binding protein